MAHTFPVQVEGRLETEPSRWLWLVKWLLAIPHYVVLFFLWVAFVVLTVVAFFAILFTGRYPRVIFDFNVGVLRWSWRVAYYAYGVLGTDRYPPFTLAEVPDYPASLEIAYPDSLSRGLVLVKWWLLALPHYLVLSVFTGGGSYLALRLSEWRGAGGFGLIGLLVLFAAIALLFTGRYPREIFDFVVGMNRWALRVGAYAALMTDAYPPFRLDAGGRESPTPDQPPAPSSASPEASATAPGTQHAGSQPPVGKGWTAVRIVTVVVGAVLALGGMGATASGAAVLWVDHTQRDTEGFIDVGPDEFTSPTYAIRSETMDLRWDAPDWITSSDFLGDVRVEGRSTGPTDPLFIGIGPADEVAGYLAPVEHDRVRELSMRFHPEYRTHAGMAPDSIPAEEPYWVASAAGTGTQEVTWSPGEGRWTVVVMNADGSRPVEADVRVAATVPWLDEVGGGLLAAGLVALAGGAVLIYLGVRRASAG